MNNLDEPHPLEMAVNVSPLNPLSIPRGVRLVDELTGEPAKIVCTIGPSTYFYASVDSQKLDYDGILNRIAPAIAELASLDESVGTAPDRVAQLKRIKTLKGDIISVCQAVAQQNLVSKNFELAVPAALRGLRTLISLHGDGGVELVSAYLVLAEVNLGLTRISQAEGFLSTANFILLRHPEASNELRSRMHRNFGRVYAAQGNNVAALESFARDIYFSTLCLGPEHISTSIGYFFLAQVFAAQANMEAALAFFDKVVDIWYKYLLGAKSAIATALGVDFRIASPEVRLAALKDATSSAVALSTLDRTEVRDAPPGEAGAPLSPSGGGDSFRLSAMQLTEGLEMLEFISRVRESQLGANHIATGEVRYTTALLLVEAHRDEEAAKLLAAAAALFEDQLVGRDMRYLHETSDCMGC